MRTVCLMTIICVSFDWVFSVINFLVVLCIWYVGLLGGLNFYGVYMVISLSAKFTTKYYVLIGLPQCWGQTEFVTSRLLESDFAYGNSVVVDVRSFCALLQAYTSDWCSVIILSWCTSHWCITVSGWQAWFELSNICYDSSLQDGTDVPVWLVSGQYSYIVSLNWLKMSIMLYSLLLYTYCFNFAVFCLFYPLSCHWLAM